MRCPKCGGDTTVHNTRLTPEGWQKRYRKCLECGRNFATFEKYREETNREKAESDIVRCGKCLLRKRCDIKDQNFFTDEDFCSYGEKG